MFYIYVLGLSNGKYYIGQTQDVEARLLRHQTSQVQSTKGLRPLELLYSEEFATRSEAMIREKYLKSLKSHKAVKEIIQSGDGPIV